MNVLVVEDDEKFIEAIREIFEKCIGGPLVDSAQSRYSAEVLLKERFYDLIVLDLRIPSEDGLLDADPQHGRAAFFSARKHAPGTPIFVLTGSSAEEFIDDFLGGSQQVDVWSQGQPIATVKFQRKIRFAEFPVAAESICKAVWSLGDVELEFSGGYQAPVEINRLLRIFARRYAAVRCTVHLVGGGLSRAKVFRLVLTSADGSLIHNAIAKLGSIADVINEGERFERYITRLGSAATPRKLHVIEHGAKDYAGVFYQLAADFTSDAFAATQDHTVAISIPDRLQGLFSPWREQVPQTRHTVREIRRVLLSDEDLRKIQQKHTLLWINDLEARQLQVRWCPIHGDLHGKNVLVAGDGSVVVIDYGDVAEGPACIDPVTFELSLLFHPDGPFKNSGWPKLEQAGSWGDLDKYLVSCPDAELVRSIRAWTEQVATGRREVAAGAYAYLVRQLKYPDNNPALIIALLEGVHLYLMST